MTRGVTIRRPHVGMADRRKPPGDWVSPLRTESASAASPARRKRMMPGLEGGAPVTVIAGVRISSRCQIDVFRETGFPVAGSAEPKPDAKPPSMS